MTWHARLPLALAFALLAPAAIADTGATPAEAPQPAAPAAESQRPERREQRGRAWWSPLPDRGWLGVRLGTRERLEQALRADTLPEEWQRVLNTRWLLEEWDGVGALVSEVFPETPAEKAGLLPGDVVLTFNGIRTGSPGELSFVVQRVVKGHDGDLEVLRDGEVRRILVEIGMHPEDARRLEEERQQKGDADGTGSLAPSVPSAP